MGLEEAHGLVSLLLTPLETPAKGSGSDNTWFQTIIARKVSEYSAQCGLSLSPGTDTYFDYVRCCVNALINLRFELTKALGNSPSDERSLAADTLDLEGISIWEMQVVVCLLESPFNFPLLLYDPTHPKSF